MNAERRGLSGIALHIDHDEYSWSYFILYKTPVENVRGYDIDPRNILLPNLVGMVAVRQEEYYGKIGARYSAVVRSKAEHGYGPTLYMIAMQYAGWLCSDPSGSSKAAQNVWNRFLYDSKNGNDIKAVVRSEEYTNMIGNEFFEKGTNYIFHLNKEIDISNALSLDQQVFKQLFDNNGVSRNRFKESLMRAAEAYFLGAI